MTATVDDLVEGGLHSALIYHTLVSEDSNYDGKWIGQSSCSDNVTKVEVFMGATVLVANDTGILNHPNKLNDFLNVYEEYSDSEFLSDRVYDCPVTCAHFDSHHYGGRSNPPPVLESAIFEDAASSILVTFDSATNKAGIQASNFRCSDLFVNDVAGYESLSGLPLASLGNRASCSWLNSYTVVTNFGLEVNIVR